MKSIATAFLLACIAVQVQATDFVAYGDSRSNEAVHRRIVNALCRENPELVMHVGDIWEGYSPEKWMEDIKSNPVSRALLDSNRFLVTKGNHEANVSEITNVRPAIVRNGTIHYSLTQGNCFFICAGQEPTNLQWIEAQLKSEESRKARWRIVWAHNPCYSTGQHEVDGAYPDFRALLDKYHVDLYFSGHDHTYERTHLMRDGKVVGSSRSFDLGRNPGTVYVVTGGAGAPLYTFQAAKTWSACRLSAYNYCSVKTSDSKLVFKAMGIQGGVIDEFVMTK